MHIDGNFHLWWDGAGLISITACWQMGALFYPIFCVLHRSVLRFVLHLFCFSVVSDPEECCRAAGVCSHVQCWAAEVVLPPVHCPQHGRTPGSQVSGHKKDLNFMQSFVCSAKSGCGEKCIGQGGQKVWQSASGRVIDNNHLLSKTSWHSLNIMGIVCVCVCVCSERLMFSVMKCCWSCLHPTGGWWVISRVDPTHTLLGLWSSTAQTTIVCFMSNNDNPMFVQMCYDFSLDWHSLNGGY